MSVGILRRAFVLLTALLLLATLAVPASARTVTPGAFCSQADAGSYGHTVTGLRMRCTTTSSDSRLRWRAAPGGSGGGSDSGGGSGGGGSSSGFADIAGNSHAGAINQLIARGITKGCTPNGSHYCPRDKVTRAQMAAFLSRALGLTNASHSGFRDVPRGSTFDQDIRRLARAGITLGCNPPANDRFCPGDPVTRQQMAGFLDRALDLPMTNHPGFRDVPSGSRFDGEIRRLAAAGITRGCTSSNARFCPTEHVTRDQMASFIIRGIS